MIDERFVIIGAILVLLGSLGYLRDTIAGRVQPNRVSWLLWTAAPMLAFSAEMSHGVGMLALMTFVIGFGPLLIFIGSFFNRQASWKLTKLDIICGVFSLAGLVLWQVTGSGMVAILLSIMADSLASVPTLVKSYRNPESESWFVYLFWAVSAGLTLLAIDTWTPAAFAFPLYILLLGATLAILIKFKLGVRRLSKPEVLVGGDQV